MTTSAPSTLIAETEELQISYETRGPTDGKPVLLLHGWPDDVRTWDTVATALANAGYRTIAPSLRGFGSTKFREVSTPRTAQPTTLASDAIQLLSVLGIERATVVGHDWGGRVGYVLAALWPERVEHLVALSVGYEMGIKSGSHLPYDQGHAYWYQWFFGSERGREALRDNRRELCKYLWQTWAPTWKFSDAEFTKTAASWDNPDWVEITLHSYRSRWGNAPIDQRYAESEARMSKQPPIAVPTTMLHGELDGASLTKSSERQSPLFAASYRRDVLPGVGHFIPREKPESIVAAVLRHPH